MIEIDTDSHKVFKHLANNVPESSVQHCPGIQYYDTDDQPGEDNTWVRQLYSNVCILWDPTLIIYLMCCYEHSLQSFPNPIFLLVQSQAIPLIHASRNDILPYVFSRFYVCVP